MKKETVKVNPFAAFAAAMLLLASLILSAAALESNVFTITQKTLSVELGPSFEIDGGELNASKQGMISHDFLINNTAAPGTAFISVFSVYDAIMRRMSPGSLSELFLIGGMSAIEDRGDRETGNWTAPDRQGNKVTVHSMSTKDERIQILGGSYDMAVWSLDNSTHAVMVSLLDRNNTTQIIKTLAVV
ncbi:MAG: hypothetical protein LUQ21_03660 [Methanothrix sp.]|nr:hypothetical protein [Methanothrix sp.]